MGSGFLVSDNVAATGLTTAWKAITLAFGIAAEPKSSPPVKPGKIHGWKVELDLTTVAGGALYIYSGITYDAGATKTACPASDRASLTDFLGTGAHWSAGFNLTDGVELNWPGTTYNLAAPTLTLWLKLDAGTANLAINGARLQYTESPNG